MSLLSNRRPASHAAMALTLVVLAFAACSGGSGASATPASSVPEASSTPVSAPAGSASAGGVSAGAAIDVCALLPADQVATITKTSITGSTSRQNGLANDSGCTYSTSALASAVVIDVVTPGGATDYAAQLARAGTNAVSFAGLGDKAFQDATDGTGLVALFGDTEFDVYASDPTNTLTQDQENALEAALITSLQAKL
jgi:hypothetical protein